MQEAVEKRRQTVDVIHHSPPPAAEDPLLDLARQHLGVDYLYPYQRLVVANTIDAVQTEERELANQIVVLPTGSGKTLCFSLPAWIVNGITVVVYPLLALMKDQERRAAFAGMSVAILRGGQTREERRQIIATIHRHEVQLVITNPETLTSPDVQETLSAVTVDHLVIDEAHCVSEWGESFRPAYLELGSSIRRISPVVTTAFTATASDPVLQSVRAHLFGSAPVRLIRADPDRPNIAYSVLIAFSKLRVLTSLLSDASLQRPAVIFTRSRTRAEEIARSLSDAVKPNQIASYHAGLSSQTREAIEQWFFESKNGVLVTTCAYGIR
jgi:ATP-dependent DNA helicase RecQ